MDQHQDIIEKLITQKKFKELRDNLREDYFKSSNEEGFDKISDKQDKGLRQDITMALNHLDFICRHGEGENAVRLPDGKLDIAYPDIFKRWVSNGAKGFLPETIQKLSKII